MGVCRSNNGPFTMIPNAAIDYGLTPVAIAVLLIALRRRDSTVFAASDFASAGSRNTVYRALDELREAGFVSGSLREGLTFYDVPFACKDADDQCEKTECGNVQHLSAKCSTYEHCRKNNVQNLSAECSSFERAYNEYNTQEKEEEEEKIFPSPDSEAHHVNVVAAARRAAPTDVGPLAESAVPHGVLFTERSANFNAANVRGIIEFDNPSVAALRQQVSSALWVESVYADVIDRATAAILFKFPGASLKDYTRIRDESQREADRSNRGAWVYVAPRIQSIYESAGWAWSDSYRRIFEPKPRAAQKPSAGDEYLTEMSELIAENDIESNDDREIIYNKLLQGGMRVDIARRNAGMISRLLSDVRSGFVRLATLKK